MTVETNIRVRYQETDQMGLVHHSVYAVWFEVGRTALIQEMGVSYAELEQQGILLPVVDLHCRFVAPARYDETVTILTRVGEMRGAKLVLRYEVRGGAGALLTRGETTHLWVDGDMKRVSLREVCPQLYRNLSAAAADTC